jgi:hypothetical protein
VAERKVHHPTGTVGVAPAERLTHTLVHAGKKHRNVGCDVLVAIEFVLRIEILNARGNGVAGCDDVNAESAIRWVRLLPQTQPPPVMRMISDHSGQEVGETWMETSPPPSCTKR